MTLFEKVKVSGELGQLHSKSSLNAFDRIHDLAISEF
jgi:hypothetical protein